MANQLSLTWGNLTLCDPSDGWSGYQLTSVNQPSLEAVEVIIPNSSGRIKRIVGAAQSESTSLQLSFDVVGYFANGSALRSFISNLEDAMTDAYNPLRTINYGLINDQTNFSHDNMDMAISLGTVDKSYDGMWLEYNVTFTQWGQS